MTPRWIMPMGSDAARRAALERVRCELGALRCATRLLGQRPPGPRSAALAHAMMGALRRAERALARLSRPSPTAR